MESLLITYLNKREKIMKAIWNNAVIAESNTTVTVEGTQYFPFDSVNKEYLRESAHTSTCSWKGLANYFSIEVDGKVNENAAWVYKSPKSSAAEITNYIAFWQGVTVSE